MKVFKTVVIITLIIAFFSCSSSDYLNDKKEEINYILGSSDFKESQIDNSYLVEVDNSNLNSPGSRELGASIVSLVLFEEFYKTKSLANTESSFGVRFIDYDESYVYPLSIVASAKSGRESCEKVLNSLIKGEDLRSYYFYNKENKDSIWDRTGLGWSSFNDFGVIGFEVSQMSFYDNQFDVLIYHYAVEPSLKEIYIYIELNSNKILTILA